MELSLRADNPIALLRFYSVCPPALIEASRLQTSVPHLKQIADVICNTLDYYPVKVTTA
jgi:hypothetical protein